MQCFIGSLITGSGGINLLLPLLPLNCHSVEFSASKKPTTTDWLTGWLASIVWVWVEFRIPRHPGHCCGYCALSLSLWLEEAPRAHCWQQQQHWAFLSLSFSNFKWERSSSKAKHLCRADVAPRSSSSAWKNSWIVRALADCLSELAASFALDANILCVSF